MKSALETEPARIPAKDALIEAARLMDVAAHVKNGREPSMYTDLIDDGTRVTSPANLVRPISAKSCVKLAHDLLAQTTRPSTVATIFDCMVSSKTRPVFAT